MRILLAFDKFKGALTADEACSLAGETLRGLGIPGLTISEAPLTDGGEGFCSILARARGGRLEECRVRDPLGRSISAPIGWVESGDLPEAARARISSAPGERVAIIEMASASGLLLLRECERDPWKTSTYGTGELIRKAVESGADRIVLGVGGSATNDCGAGVLEALGARFESRDGSRVEEVCPEKFAEIESVDFSGILSLPPVCIASDVQSPLLGDTGATRVFGPQKGLKEVERMEVAFERMAARIASASSRNPSPSDAAMGAAGGISYGLSAVSAVAMEPGFSLVSDWMGLDEKISNSDWVLTGEGRLDSGSLSGKGPVSLVRQVAAGGGHAKVFAGAVESGVPERLREELGGVLECTVLSDPEWPIERALAETGARLKEELIRWATKEFSPHG